MWWFRCTRLSALLRLRLQIDRCIRCIWVYIGDYVYVNGFDCRETAKLAAACRQQIQYLVDTCEWQGKCNSNSSIKLCSYKITDIACHTHTHTHRQMEHKMQMLPRFRGQVRLLTAIAPLDTPSIPSIAKVAVSTVPIHATHLPLELLQLLQMCGFSNLAAN